MTDTTAALKADWGLPQPEPEPKAEVECSCGNMFEPYDEEDDEDGLYYQRTSGDQVCWQCRPKSFEPHEAFCRYYDRRNGRDMTVQVIEALEAAGYEVITHDARQFIIQISKDDEVVFDYPGEDPDEFGGIEAEEVWHLLPPVIQLICQQVYFDDLLELAEDHDVSEDTIDRARDRLNRIKKLVT